MCFRGYASNGGNCGLAYVNSNNGVGNANANYGGRLYFAFNKKTTGTNTYSIHLISEVSEHQEKSRLIAGIGKTDNKMNTIDIISSESNINRAIDKLCRGKTHRNEVRYILGHRDDVVPYISDLIKSGKYKSLHPLTMSRIENGKQRNITYTNMYPDALVRHAVTAVMFDVFLPKFIPDVYCNINRRGLKYGIERMKTHIAESGFRYYLKEDIHHYFETVDQDTLLRIIHEESGCDESTMGLIRGMLSLCKSGMAIGTYDCQLWANVYLMRLDRYILDKYGSSIRYGRYCDNMYILADDVNTLHKVHQDIKSFARSLKLSMNPCEFGCISQGLSCMGVVLYPSYARLSRRIKERMRRSSNIPSYFGWMKLVNSHNLIRRIMYKKFSDFIDIPEYITSFTGDKVELSQITGKRIFITDCIIEKSKFTKRDGELRDRAKVAFKYDLSSDKDYVFFSSSKPILHYCSAFIRDKPKYLPCEATIERINKQYKFRSYEQN